MYHSVNIRRPLMGIGSLLLCGSRGSNPGLSGLVTSAFLPSEPSSGPGPFLFLPPSSSFLFFFFFK